MGRFHESPRLNTGFRVLIIAGLAVHLWGFGTKTDKKIRAEARRIVAEAQKAEKQGGLVAARQQYVKSEDLLPSKEAESGLERVSKAAREKAKHLIRG